MFVYYRTRGIILKKIDRKESDQLFTLYTEDFGKLNVLGRAIRKISSKLRAGMETFYLSEIEFIQGKTYKILTDAVLVERFKDLRSNFERLNLASKISENLDDLVSGQETDKNIWNLLKETFHNLNSPRFRLSVCDLQYYYFFWNLLSALGYGPELYKCSVCRGRLSPEKLYFSQEEGGVICYNCHLKKNDSREVNSDTVKILRLILDKNERIIYKLKIRDKELDMLDNVSKDYLSFILERNVEPGMTI